MIPTHPTLRSTRLENLGLESYGFRFDLDGQTVQIRGDSRTPLVGALQAFHRQALEDFEAHQARPRPGWASRLRSWIGRLFGAAPGSPAAEAPAASRPAPAPGPSPGTRPVPAELPQAGAADAGASRAGRPGASLRAVYADKDGVHVIWQPAGTKGPPRPVAMNYRLDSELAGRLQDCYSHLAELGYKVAGLELLVPQGAPAARPGTRSPGPEPGTAAAVPDAGKARAAEGAIRPRAPRQRAAPARTAEQAPAPDADPVAAASGRGDPEPGPG